MRNYKQAEEYFSKSLEIERKLNNELGIAETLHELGNIYAIQEKYAEAQKYYFESLQMKIKLKDKLGEAITRAALGQIYLLRGNPEEAMEMWRTSLPVLEANGLPEAKVVRDWIRSSRSRMERERLRKLKFMEMHK